MKTPSDKKISVICVTIGLVFLLIGLDACFFQSVISQKFLQAMVWQISLLPKIFPVQMNSANRGLTYFLSHGRNTVCATVQSSGLITLSFLGLLYSILLWFEPQLQKHWLRWLAILVSWFYVTNVLRFYGMIFIPVFNSGFWKTASILTFYFASMSLLLWVINRPLKRHSG